MASNEQAVGFADVILPLHLPDTYTYSVPEALAGEVRLGVRVVVQFGAKRLYSAVVSRVHNVAPSFETKSILSVLDKTPIVEERQIELWRWMSRYYMCCLGDVMATALPTALKLSSESMIVLHPNYEGSLASLAPAELKIMQQLMAAGSLKLSQVASVVGFQKIMPTVNSMIEKQIVILEEELKSRYVPKKVTILSLAPSLAEDAVALRGVFDDLEAQKKKHLQLSVLMKFMQLTSFGKKKIRKRELTECKELSPSAINTLIRNGVIVAEEMAVSRLLSQDAQLSASTIVLNEEQEAAFAGLSSLRNPDAPSVNLLYGVTSSGKTEVYIKLIAETIEQGRQALFLLPEIALTAQIINRLRRYFGNKVGVYHSRFTTIERAEVWQRTLDSTDSGYQIILGARSALFLPFHNLGLIIVDEEHDGSYKQADPAPRYNGRDSAIYLGKLWNARVVLGSATPSLESYYNATHGKYGLQVMSHRYGGLMLPEIYCVDLKEAHKKKEMNLNFSTFLVEHIKEALENKEQVILFQNRRGFAPHLECEQCHWIPQCKHCDVSLVYHKESNSMRCHYCGYTESLPSECPACHSTHIRMRGVGTERVEEDIAILFPTSRVARLDLDSVGNKNRHNDILNDFDEHNVDILVGTQMVTKGLDFKNVSVVGILNADSMLSFPDFRAFERSFQMLTQVSGRAGRHSSRGKVIIQTFNPWHAVIRNTIAHDYSSMYEAQLNERRVFRYPPFFRLILIKLFHKDKAVVNSAASQLAASLRTVFANNIIGPEYPIVARIRDLHIKQMMVRLDVGQPLAPYKVIIAQAIDSLTALDGFKNVRVQVDVDPQ